MQILPSLTMDQPGSERANLTQPKPKEGVPIPTLPSVPSVPSHPVSQIRAGRDHSSLPVFFGVLGRTMPE